MDRTGGRLIQKTSHLEYCLDERIEVVAEIPDDRGVAEIYSRGEMPADVLPSYRETIVALFESLCERLDANGIVAKTAGKRSS